MFALSAPTMFVNIAIVIGTAASVYYTQNPLCIIGLYFLQPMPQFGVTSPNQDEGYPEDDAALAEEEYSSNGIGFTGSIEK